ncbi:UrcA family protein [Hyphococcus sp.]|uniref:UrcA family protein n=1 Tax=Hyphococcus sp. TaxID=2038636 RepID=UPI0035C6E2B1
MIRTLAIAAAVFTVAQAPAFAREIVVEFETARLEDPAYLEAVKADINAAAAKVCKAEYAGSPLFSTQLRACVEETSADAIAEMTSKIAAAEAAPTQIAAK